MRTFKEGDDIYAKGFQAGLKRAAEIAAERATMNFDTCMAGKPPKNQRYRYGRDEDDLVHQAILREMKGE